MMFVVEPQRGDIGDRFSTVLSPFQGSCFIAMNYQGLPPLAIICRPLGAKRLLRRLVFPGNPTSIACPRGRGHGNLVGVFPRVDKCNLEGKRFSMIVRAEEIFGGPFRPGIVA